MRYVIPSPMLAKAAPTVPDPAKYAGGLLFEPKWDGFRGLLAWDGDSVEIGSRGAKPLTRYFPELVEAVPRILPQPCLLDGEIVVATGPVGAQRLDWEALSQRIHPAASRVATLATRTPAMFIAFDLLALGDEDLLTTPFEQRRARLETLMSEVAHPLHITRTTRDRDAAVRWLQEFEGAGLDGVVAKPLDQPYAAGTRTLIKVKHARTADVVALGYRIHRSGSGVGSLLVGLFDSDGTLRQVGGVAAWSDVRRRELIDELAPLVERDDAGAAVTDEGERSRFSGSKDVSFVRLRPERVLEVRYDQLEGSRFRHTVQFARWRPDRDARSCTYDQLDTVAGYDLADVLG
ncbi:ATP-dependent DNA ligase [Microbacterium foliorum]|uniref:DNA ligase (ATP) n=1 Tax=Microbacterium foliorum TaxID=104336 RepID=A0A0F0KSY5_9MICO|nr:ATP-dependent DNA ligase [Microbacterium foliorum]AXL11491.1 ATP-dependent DNA ligase [Microbacterium foliorum]KJL23599.1 putative DNA ligase-like protein [Microbacterium foliorum]CAH0230749.1 DNA ligase C1 [Microbacterium foliorum]CAH0257545.1 DNA ligase C1 [Microbacterium foliorum]